MRSKSGTAKGASVQERTVALVDRRAGEAIDFLEQVVNVNSGTMNHAGVQRAGQIFAEALEPLGFQCRWIPMKEVDRAGHLFAEHPGERGRRLLLIGHLDTVYEPQSPFQVFRRQGDKGIGPGAVDMKGGDVVMLFALRALHEAGLLEHSGIIVALLGDEEDTGAPVSISRRDLWEAADRSDIALGFEMSGPTPSTATLSRRGASSWMLRTSGRAGHSSRIFHTDFGAGAVFEIARVLNAFRETLAGEQYLTLSAGLLMGGTQVELRQEAAGQVIGKHNVIPAQAAASGDLRFISADQRDRAKVVMQRIVHQHLEHCGGSIHFQDAYPAMPPSAGNYNLLDELDQISRRLGADRVIPYDPADRGAADISFVADRVEACLDGLGPAGWGDHSYEETVDLATFALQIKKAALLIYRLTRGT